MIVFHIINDLRVGGAEVLVAQMVAHHRPDKFAPVCICTRKPVHSHLEKMVQEAGKPLFFLESRQVKLSWVYNVKLNSLYEQYRPTVVHTHLGAISVAWTLSWKHKTPVKVHTVHNIAHREIGGSVERRVKLLALRYRVGGWVPVAISKEVARTIEQVYRYKNPPIIPNGIPITDYAPNWDKRSHFRQTYGIEPTAVIILHIGRFAHQKNHSLLIQAFACLHASQPLYLWLVGDGELRPTIETLTQELGVAERVRFWGVRADVADILNAADIFTLPSKYEGSPMSVMEAMAAGLPVVATAVGGVPELVEDGVSGLLTPNEDFDALVAALQRLVDSVELRRRMSNAALQRAREKFDIRHTVRAYEALYEELLQRKRR